MALFLKKFPEMKKSRQNIIFAVAFSLAIHLAMGAALFYGLSNKSVSSLSVHKLNLVWVALAAKNKPGMGAADRYFVAAATTSNASSKAAAQELPKAGKGNREVLDTSPEPGFSGSVILAGYNGPVTAMAQKEQAYNAPANKAEASVSPSAPVTDAYPLYRENVPPLYPELARIRGYEGIVLVHAEILPDGRVGSLKIRKSSGYAILDKSALDAVKPWKFEPAKKSGKPSAAWVELPIKFVLHDDSSPS
jgi:protein TonB